MRRPGLGLGVFAVACFAALPTVAQEPARSALQLHTPKSSLNLFRLNAGIQPARQLDPSRYQMVQPLNRASVDFGALRPQQTMRGLMRQDTDPGQMFVGEMQQTSIDPQRMTLGKANIVQIDPGVLNHQTLVPNTWLNPGKLSNQSTQPAPIIDFGQYQPPPILRSNTAYDSAIFFPTVTRAPSQTTAPPQAAARRSTSAGRSLGW